MMVPKAGERAGENDGKAALPQSHGGAFLRVEAAKISHLMDLVGELGLGVAEVIHSPDLRSLELPEFEKSAHRLKLLVNEVQGVSTELRLVEVGDVFRRMRRMVRELERQTGKKIDLLLEGEDVRVDKAVVDLLYEPLVHVVRNSADHGLESPADRLAAGKPETGTITLGAAQVGSEIHIIVADDGRGLNRELILARARERGLIDRDADPDDQSLWGVIFQPGFSTAETVTSISGRGVGMDVLNTAIKKLRGRVGVDSVAGQGARVTLSIPLMLSFLDCLVMRVGLRLFAVPVDVIGEVFRPSHAQILHVSARQGTQYLHLRGESIPVCRLQAFYGEDAARSVSVETSIVVVLNTSTGPVGLLVDQMFDQQQVVMKPLQGYLQHIRASLGCALLGSGEVATVLDVECLKPDAM